MGKLTKIIPIQGVGLMDFQDIGGRIKERCRGAMISVRDMVREHNFHGHNVR